MPQSDYHSLKVLKGFTYSIWCDLNRIEVEDQYGEQFAEQYARFKQAMHSQFGDLRYKVTWEHAWASLTADHIWTNMDDSKFLIRTFTYYAPKEGWDHLVPLILDRLLTHERVLDCIKRGLERIVQTSSSDADFMPEREFLYAVQSAIQRRQPTAVERGLPTAA